MANSIKVTVTVHAPVEKVWDIFMNPDSLKYWLTGFVSVEHLSGIQGEAGSTSKLRFTERGQVLEVVEKVLHVVPKRRYSFSMQHKNLDTLTDVRLISFGQHTEMIQAVTFLPKGIFMKCMMPFLKGGMKKRMAGDLQNLKAVIEKN